VFKNWYSLNLENREHALRGWNWGKAEFGKAELSFNVQSRPAFEIPYTEISNTNLAGKNEVSVDFSLPANGDETGTNGHLGGSRKNGRKSGAAQDQLVEMRFYIPGTVTRKEKKEDGEDVSDGEDAEEQNAANLFQETLMNKAEIGDVAGDNYASFQDILHLTPRFVSSHLLRLENTDELSEDVSISTCTRSRSDCAERHTTTRSNMRRSRNSCCCLSQMMFTHLSPSAWIHR
jgi:structure-specific recognition protein 1